MPLSVLFEVLTEANAVRRRPEPENHDNVWQQQRIAVKDHEAALQKAAQAGNRGQGLKLIFGTKELFTLLRMGTVTFFDSVSGKEGDPSLVPPSPAAHAILRVLTAGETVCQTVLW